MAQSVLDIKPTIQDQVFAWRMESFIKLGYDPDMAEALAYSEIDLGEARKLVERGCPLILVAQILG